MPSYSELMKDWANGKCKPVKTMLFTTGGRRAKYNVVLDRGHLWPSTIQEVKAMRKKGWFDVLGIEDVKDIEFVLNSIGKKGEYQYTKSKSWVRVLNPIDDILDGIEKNLKYKPSATLK